MKIAPILFAILFYHSSSSQDLNKKHMNDFRTGINFGNGSPSKIGAYMGYFHWFYANTPVSFGIGLEYSRSNKFIAVTSESAFTQGYDWTYSFRSLSVPVYLRINGKKKYSPYLEIGAFSNIIDKAQRQGYAEYFSNNGHYRKLVNQDLGVSLIPGGNVGLGFSFNAKEVIPFIQANYRFVWNDYHGRTPVYNRFIQLVLGLRF